MNCKCLIIVLGILSATFAKAQTEVSRATMIGIGGVNRYDTYLSPLEYKGTDYRFISSVLRSKRASNDSAAIVGNENKRLPLVSDIELTHDGGIDYSHNKANNAHTLSGHYDFAVSLMHRWNLLEGDLVVRAGGMAELYLGFAYNMRNSANNPAQGYASLGIGGACMATYSTPLHLKGRAIKVQYESRLPLIGVMFSPNYGQSYYEMFDNGNYDHNVVMTSVAVPSYRHMLNVDVPVCNRTAIRVGYLGEYRQSKPNSLRQHVYTNAFVIGVVSKLK